MNQLPSPTVSDWSGTLSNTVLPFSDNNFTADLQLDLTKLVAKI